MRGLKTQHVGIALLLVGLAMQLRTLSERKRLTASVTLPMILAVILLAGLTASLDATGGRPMTMKVAIRMLGFGAIVGVIALARHRGWL